MTNGTSSKQSLLAVASFTSALLIFFPPAWIAALVLGVVALVEIKQSGGALRGRGLAIAGMALSLVWTIALVIFLAASFANARQNAADMFPPAQTEPANYDEGTEEPDIPTDNATTTPLTPTVTPSAAPTKKAAPPATSAPANQTPATKP